MAAGERPPRGEGVAAREKLTKVPFTPAEKECVFQVKLIFLS